MSHTESRISQELLPPELEFDSSKWGDLINRPLYKAVLVGLLIFGASLFGILTRPVGFLAAFWPANALLLGVMVRFPSLATMRGWVAATIGYLAADLLTGGGLVMTVWLTAANLAGAATGVVLFRMLSEEDRKLKRPLLALLLFAVCALTGVAAALVGGWAGPVLIGKNVLTSLAFWFVTELVNSMLLLPFIFSSPDWSKVRMGFDRRAHGNGVTKNWVPVLALLLSMIGSILLGGPGAIMFSVPALLWCALTYDLFWTSALTLLCCSWMLIAVSSGAFVVYPVVDYINETMSLRLGISLLALGPLTAASINSSREQLLQSLTHAVDHDYLTGVLARRAFMRLGEEAIALHQIKKTRLSSSGEKENMLGPAILMLDVDHFKGVNDRFGHSAGDQVLVAVADVVSRQLREGDLVGRLGGEEFAIFLPRIAPKDAQTVASRIRMAVEVAQTNIASGEVLKVTVSIGLAFVKSQEHATLDEVLSNADMALYRSKHDGRNRVTVYSPNGS